MITSTTFEDRHLGIGGSDLDDVFEFSDYGCKRKLWYSKRQVEKDYDGQSFQIRRGKRLEKVAFDYFAERFRADSPEFTGLILHSSDDRINSSIYVSDRPHIRVNIDGFVVDDATDLSTAIPVEIKVLGVDNFIQYKKTGLPKGYCAQLQWACGILEKSKGYFGIYCPELDALEFFDITFDITFFENAQQASTDIYAAIKSGISPIRRRPEEEETLPRACLYCGWRKTCRGLGSNGKPLKAFQDLDLDKF